MSTLFEQKTFRGANVAEAMQQVKAEFGNDAIVISKREVQAKKGLLKRSSTPMVEIDAASAQSQKAMADEIRHIGGSALLGKKYGQPAIINANETARRVDNDVQVELSKYKNHAPLKTENTTPSSYANISANGSDLMHAVQEAVRSGMHAEMLRLTSNFACGGVPPVGERFLDVYNRLIENSVDAVLARELVIKLQYELGSSPLLNDDVLEIALRRMIAEEFRLGEKMPEDGKQKIVTVVGPSGCGKTTTVVKLAFAAFSQQKNVGLITTDYNRPGAEAQLRALIQLMSLPLAVANTPQRLVDEVHNLAAMDLIIIDTTGCSVRDDKGLKELQAHLTAITPDEIHLVLPATMAELSALAFAKAYRGCGYNRVLLSKLDEAASFGMALNIARKIPEPFSYLAVGQAFRNGLQIADANELAKLVAGETPNVNC